MSEGTWGAEFRASQYDLDSPFFPQEALACRFHEGDRVRGKASGVAATVERAWLAETELVPLFAKHPWNRRQAEWVQVRYDDEAFSRLMLAQHFDPEGT